MLERHGSMGSGKRHSLSGAGLMGLRGLNAQDQGSVSGLTHKTGEQFKEKDIKYIIVSNCVENIILFLMLLNSVIYPNAATAVYYVITLSLTGISLTKDRKKVQLKYGISIAALVITLLILIAKAIILVLLNHEGEITLTSDQRLMYDSLGVRIDQTMKNIKVYNTFMTLFFDCVQAFFTFILAVVVYSWQLYDCKNSQAQNIQQSILHPVAFSKYYETLCIIALLSLAVSTIFIQTIIQAFILCVLILIVYAWANDNLDRNELRVLTLNFAQGIIILQLTITFVLQVAFVNFELVPFESSMVWDMFGFFLHNLHLYQVILHLVALCFSVQAIQLFRTTRNSYLKDQAAGGFEPAVPMVLGGGGDTDKRSMHFATKRFGTSEKGKTVGSVGGFKSTGRKSYAVERFREKNIEAQLRRADESSFFQYAQKINYKDYSPQIFLMVCRVVAFIWCYAYHDFQSWILLGWIMHSTLFVSMKKFFFQTVTYYLPVFLLTFLFYYVINIPRMIEFESTKLHYDTSLSLGLYQFRIPPVEVTFFMLALLPFFFLIKSRKYLTFNREEQKQRFLEKLSRKDSPTLFYILFSFITNLDMIVFLAIFFSGVNKIDFYHVFLMFFFVAYIVAPVWFKRNYVYLLYYVTFFVFEKYLYTLLDHLLPPNSTVQQLLDVLGLSTDYDEKSDKQYFRYVPKPQQWMLIVLVFLQHQVHKLTHDEQLVEKFAEEVSGNFKQRYPRIYHFWELLQHIKKECLILLTFIVFFVIIIFSDKNIINWGFQIIICIFIISYVGVSHTSHVNGIKRLQSAWPMIIWYSSFVLIVQITFQFAALPFIRKSLHLDFILNLLPLWIRQNLRFIGFQIYTEYIWQKFVVYLMYFTIGIYVKDQMLLWKMAEDSSKFVELKQLDNNQMQEFSRGSDNQPYFPEQDLIDYEKEFLKIRFTTPYLVYKLRRLWFVIDKCSQLIFVFISLMIMILATQWQISLSMAVHLTCFIGLCLQIANILYQHRKIDKNKLKNNKQGVGKDKYKKSLTIDECEQLWEDYKRSVNRQQVKIRQRVWFLQFVVTLLCIAIIYPTEIIYYVKKTFIEQGDEQELVALLDYITFYLFWVGVYHSPKAISGHGYFYNLYGYLIILLLLVFEKNAQKWALDRFGCTPEKVKHFKEIEENLLKLEKKPTANDIPNQIILEAENEDEGNSELGQSRLVKSHDESASRLKHSQSGVSESYNEYRDNNDYKNLSEEELKAELKQWISKKYMLKLLSGFKIFLEETIQLLMLISSVYKDSVVGLVLLFGVFLFMILRKTKTIARLAWITGICMMVQYGLALSNLTTDNNPMDFPFPFNPYPPTPQDEGEFFIPWYRKIPLLADSFPWQVYLSMGVSNVKINTIWIDYIIMGCIQASLFYFGCQLFSLQLKVLKGDYIDEYTRRYVEMVTGKKADEHSIQKETKKLKRQVPTYTFYKAAQIIVFMHFHQITIVVTLLLSILARSLVSFGYILVCMVMIYENHKYFTPDQRNFKLKEVLKYFLQPYVIIDITLQLIFQIPIEWLHAGQDEPSSWQNIIGLQDIWTEDATQVNEVTAKSITFIILKAFTFYFVTLQIQIFDSAAYEKYRGQGSDFQKFLKMAKKKGQAIMWRFNNEKIEKIKQQQQEKSKMDKMLLNLKKVLTKWQSHINTDMDKRMQVIFDMEGSVRDSIAMKKPIKHGLTKRESTLDNDSDKDDFPDVYFKSESQMQKQQTVFSQRTKQRKSTFLKSASVSFRENRSSTVSSMLDDCDIFVDKEEKLILEQMKGKLNIVVRLYIWIKKVATDQIVFISSKNYLNKVSNEMQKGKLNIYTKMERKMLSDIRDFRKKTKYSQQEIQLADMKRTMQLTKITKILQSYVRLIIEILVSYSDSVCYILMLVSMMKNAGLISILYPFFVFGYAIFEEINPNKVIWYRLMIYTELMIMAKFIVQLSFWDAMLTPTQLVNIQDTMNGIHLGLIRVDSDAFAKMVAYFLPEILILLAIMAHIQKQIMMGSLDFKGQSDNVSKDMIKVEGIEEALQRYVKHNELQSIKETNITRKGSLDDVHDYSLIELDGKEDMIINREGQARPRAISMVEMKDLQKVYEIVFSKEIAEKQIIELNLKKGFLEKSLSALTQVFFKNAYFERLFPSIKEQKPGKDLYAVMATFQFIICLFMIFFYTKMDADVTNISDVLQYNQFSGQMVIALFLQILVMIIDRYLYKAKTFINQQVQHAEQKRGPQDESIAANALESIKVQKEKEGIMYMLGKMKHFEKQDTADQKDVDRQILLENTKVTIAMVSKYYLQFTLLIIVHGFVFWYFPIMGNIKLQNYPYCVTKTSLIQDTSIINCNEFGDNWALVIFYILYCGYFWVSSLQIKFGVSEIKKGNFLMNSYHIVNYVCFKGFMAIPFLFELKTFADWTFTKTALDVFQWFVLSATHAELYIAHSLQGRYQKKPLGKPVQMILKVILGFFGQLFIIILIAGPLLLFSTFNPISTPNPVIDAQIQFNILIEPQNSQARNTINLFTNNYVTTIKTISSTQYNTMSFQNDPKTKSFDKDLIQFVKMNNFPDATWEVSFPNRKSLQQEFQRAVNNQSTANLYFQLAYIFDRHSSSIPQAHNPQKYFNLSDPTYRPALVNFSRAFSLDCSKVPNQTIFIPEFFTGVLFLNDDEIAIPATNSIWKKGLEVTYSCKDYWTVDQELNQTKPEANLASSKNPGIAFFTFSSKTAPSYFRYSVLTFYLSIVLVIGRLIRGILVIGGNRIFIFEIPRAEPLLQLCECVHIYRMKQQLEKEEQLYFTFVDIMRSPEMIKAITGSAMKKKTQ